MKIGDIIIVRGERCRVYKAHGMGTYDVESLVDGRCYRVSGYAMVEARGGAGKTLLGLALLATLAAFSGCQRASITPTAQAKVCTTDANCERKASPTPRETHYCKGVTLKGGHCTRHVKAEGDYCWQHEIQANPCWRPAGSQPKEDCYYIDGDVTRPIPGKP